MADIDTLRELAGRLAAAQANGDPTKYICMPWITVAEAHRDAAAILALLDENERLRAALTECAAPYSSPPTTVMGGANYVACEFQRRMQVAAEALAHP